MFVWPLTSNANNTSHTCCHHTFLFAEALFKTHVHKVSPGYMFSHLQAISGVCNASINSPPFQLEINSNMLLFRDVSSSTAEQLLSLWALSLLALYLSSVSFSLSAETLYGTG